MGEPAGWQRSVEEFVLTQIGDPPAKVLEVGCGEGELARALACVGHSVTAIDPRAPEGPIFRRERIEESSAPAPFDHVVAILSLHHVEDLGMALGSIADLGIPPTGERVAAQQSHWFRVADGKVAEHWAVRDALGMMRQLGVMPS